MNEYIDELIKLSVKASEQKEVPIAALIVDNGKVISSDYNKRIQLNDVTAHAEVLALKKAAQIKGDWRLNDCDLYVTLEPCDMCKEIIKESRIRNVYYLIEKYDYKKGFCKTNISSIQNIENDDKIEEYKKILKDFFEINCKR